MSGTSSNAIQAKREKKTTSKMERLQHSAEPTDFDAVDKTLIGRATAAVVKDGSAIMFGLTQDGGALCITILEGGDRHKEYLHGVDETERYLAGLEELYGSG